MICKFTNTKNDDKYEKDWKSISFLLPFLVQPTEIVDGSIVVKFCAFTLIATGRKSLQCVHNQRFSYYLCTDLVHKQPFNNKVKNA